MALDELITNFITLDILKEKMSNKNSSLKISQIIDKEILRNLPFNLTSDQKKSIKEINYDLSQPKTMMRLLQGDVGCGKTIVAIHAMISVAKIGFQAA